MKTATLALLALAALTLAGCATFRATTGAVGSIAKGVRDDVTSAKNLAAELRESAQPDDAPIDTVVPLGPPRTVNGLKIYRPTLEK